MDNWESKEEVIKGKKGEELVRDELESKGYVVYEPITPKAHAFDFLAVKNKTDIKIVEVKTKPRLIRYNATGFNLNHYNQYLMNQKNTGLDFVCFFVDPHKDVKAIYCQSITELQKDYIAADGRKYPLILNEGKWNATIIFHLDKMKNVRALSEEEVNFILT